MSEIKPTCYDPALIMNVCAEFHHVTAREVVGPRRLRHLVVARHVAMYLLRKFTNLSLEQIGFRIGGRDHSTVIHGVRAVCDRIATGDEGYIVPIQCIERNLDTASRVATELDFV